REIRLEGVDISAELANLRRDGVDFGLVGGDQQIKILARAAFRKLESDSGGSAGDDGELSAVGHLKLLRISVAPFRRITGSAVSRSFRFSRARPGTRRARASFHSAAHGE